MIRRAITPTRESHGFPGELLLGLRTGPVRRESNPAGSSLPCRLDRSSWGRESAIPSRTREIHIMEEILAVIAGIYAVNSALAQNDDLYRREEISCV